VRDSIFWGFIRSGDFRLYFSKQRTKKINSKKSSLSIGGFIVEPLTSWWRRAWLVLSCMRTRPSNFSNSFEIRQAKKNWAERISSALRMTKRMTFQWISLFRSDRLWLWTLERKGNPHGKVIRTRYLFRVRMTFPSMSLWSILERVTNVHNQSLSLRKREIRGLFFVVRSFVIYIQFLQLSFALLDILSSGCRSIGLKRVGNLERMSKSAGETKLPPKLIIAKHVLINLILILLF